MDCKYECKLETNPYFQQFFSTTKLSRLFAFKCSIWHLNKQNNSLLAPINFLVQNVSSLKPPSLSPFQVSSTPPPMLVSRSTWWPTWNWSFLQTTSSINYTQTSTYLFVIPFWTCGTWIRRCNLHWRMFSTKCRMRIEVGFLKGVLVFRWYLK